eukprot:7385630-Prymnesium_polylepis.1
MALLAQLNSKPRKWAPAGETGGGGDGTGDVGGKSGGPVCPGWQSKREYKCDIWTWTCSEGPRETGTEARGAAMTGLGESTCATPSRLIRSYHSQVGLRPTAPHHYAHGTPQENNEAASTHLPPHRTSEDDYQGTHTSTRPHRRSISKRRSPAVVEAGAIRQTRHPPHTLMKARSTQQTSSVPRVCALDVSPALLSSVSVLSSWLPLSLSLSSRMPVPPSRRHSH